MAAVLAPQTLARGRQGSGPESGGTLSLDPGPWGAGPGPRCVDPPGALPVPARPPRRPPGCQPAAPPRSPWRRGSSEVPAAGRTGRTARAWRGQLAGQWAARRCAARTRSGLDVRPGRWPGRVGASRAPARRREGPRVCAGGVGWGGRRAQVCPAWGGTVSAPGQAGIPAPQPFFLFPSPAATPDSPHLLPPARGHRARPKVRSSSHSCLELSAVGPGSASVPSLCGS